MGFLRYLVYGVVGALGGILGNLLAAVLEPSLGHVTLLQAIGLTVGILGTIALGYWVELSSRRQSDFAVAELTADLDEERRSLYKIWERYQSRIPLTPRDIDRWQDHQQNIADIKWQLKSLKVVVTDDLIDNRPAPSLGFLMRTLLSLRDVAMLFALPFLLAAGIAYMTLPSIQSVALTYGYPVPKTRPGTWTGLAAQATVVAEYQAEVAEATRVAESPQISAAATPTAEAAVVILPTPDSSPQISLGPPTQSASTRSYDFRHTILIVIAALAILFFGISLHRSSLLTWPKLRGMKIEYASDLSYGEVLLPASRNSCEFEIEAWPSPLRLKVKAKHSKDRGLVLLATLGTHYGIPKILLIGPAEGERLPLPVDDRGYFVWPIGDTLRIDEQRIFLTLKSSDSS